MMLIGNVDDISRWYLGGEWGVRVVVGSSVFKLPSVYTAIGVVDSKG